VKCINSGTLDLQILVLIIRNCAAASGYGYGLGIARDCNGNLYIGHGGGLPGFGSHWQIKPNYNVGIVIFSNRTYGPVSRLTVPILDSLTTLAALQPYQLPPSSILEQRKKELTALLPEWKQCRAEQDFCRKLFP
jgi:CubicO group peptidase (beta-lactamase class C family)